MTSQKLNNQGSLLKGGYNNSLHVPLAVPTAAPTPPPWTPFFLISSTGPTSLPPFTSPYPGPPNRDTRANALATPSANYPLVIAWNNRCHRSMRFCVVSWLLSFQVPLGILCICTYTATLQHPALIAVYFEEGSTTRERRTDCRQALMVVWLRVKDAEEDSEKQTSWERGQPNVPVLVPVWISNYLSFWRVCPHLLVSGVAPANQTKERSVHELFAGAFRSKSSMWIVLVFQRKNTRVHKNGWNSWTFRFGPFFGLVCQGDSW